LEQHLWHHPSSRQAQSSKQKSELSASVRLCESRAA
jgi:hypothetical protein